MIDRRFRSNKSCPISCLFPFFTNYNSTWTEIKIIKELSFDFPLKEKVSPEVLLLEFEANKLDSFRLILVIYLLHSNALQTKYISEGKSREERRKTWRKKHLKDRKAWKEKNHRRKMPINNFNCVYGKPHKTPACVALGSLSGRFVQGGENSF